MTIALILGAVGIAALLLIGYLVFKLDKAENEVHGLHGELHTAEFNAEQLNLALSALVMAPALQDTDRLTNTDREALRGARVILKHVAEQG